MCCDKRYIYTSDLYRETNYSEWNSTANPIDTTALASGDFIHDGFIPISCATADTAGLGEIVALKLVEHEIGSLQKKDLRIWVFNTDVGTIAKNAARAWTAAQSLVIAGYIDVVTADYLDVGATDSMIFKDLRNGTTAGGQVVSLNTVTASNTCYLAIEARAAVTFDNNAAIRVRLKIRRT